MGRARSAPCACSCNWQSIDPTAAEGDYDWSAVDPVVAGAARNGIELLPFVFGTPNWVARDLDGSECDATTARLYAPRGGGRARGVEATSSATRSTRYGPGGDFWAENPDLPETPDPRPGRSGTSRTRRRSTCRSPTSSAYAKLLAAAARRSAAADPERQDPPRWHVRHAVRGRRSPR